MKNLEPAGAEHGRNRQRHLDKPQRRRIPAPIELFYQSLDTEGAPLVSGLRKLKHTVERFYPKAWKTVEAGLAAVATGLLADNDKCIALILIGLSGVGKTLPLDCIMPDESEAELYERFYRSDRFTAASFVSHRADVKEKQLEQIDLLPRIKGKTLITPELAPLFRGKREELTDRFAVLTRVLDGDGYKTDSGAHGRRGYEGKYVFRWLGATTPLDEAAVEVMGHLGPRLLFYEVSRRESDDDDFAEVIFGEGREQAEETAKGETQHYLRAFFSRRDKLMPTAEIEFPEDLKKPLLDCSRMLVRLRAPISVTEEDGTNAQTELPERVAHALKCLAVGRALLWGRKRITGNDIRFIRYIALSSGVPGRQQVMRALIGSGGEATIEDLMRATTRSRPFVEARAKELETVGLAHVRAGGGRGNHTLVTIDEKYRSLLLNRRRPAKSLIRWPGKNLKRQRGEGKRETLNERVVE
jgi:hypothetical protein